MIGFTLTVNDLAPGAEAVDFLRKLADAFEVLGKSAAKLVASAPSAEPAPPRPLNTPAAAYAAPDAASTDPEPEPEKKPRASRSKPRAEAAPVPTETTAAPDTLGGEALLIELRRVGNLVISTAGLGGSVIRSELSARGAGKYGDLDEAGQRELLAALRAKLDGAAA